MKRSSILLFLLLVSVFFKAAVVVAQNESESTVIPVKITLLVPGSLCVTFPWSDNVTAAASSAKHSDYVLISRQSYVVFTTNATDNYRIKIAVSYPSLTFGSFTVRAYSHNALSDYLVTFDLNCSLVVFNIDLTTAPAPKYPSAQEIAEEQSKYIQDLLIQLANTTGLKIEDLLENYTSIFNGRLDEYKGEVEKKINDLRGDVSTLDKQVFQLEKIVEDLKGTVNDLSGAFKVLITDLDGEISRLKNTLQTFQANTWTSIIIVCIVFVTGILGAVKLSSEGGPTIAEITSKGYRRLDIIQQEAKFDQKKDANSDQKKENASEKRSDRGFPHFAVIFILLACVLVYFMFLFVFGGV